MTEPTTVERHLVAKHKLDPAVIGRATPGQLNVSDDEGTVHNFVGAQTVPLTDRRDGGPYLDEVEDLRAAQRRDYVLRAPSTVGINNAPVSKSVVVNAETGETTFKVTKTDITDEELFGFNDGDDKLPGTQPPKTSNEPIVDDKLEVPKSDETDEKGDSSKTTERTATGTSKTSTAKKN